MFSHLSYGLALVIVANTMSLGVVELLAVTFVLSLAMDGVFYILRKAFAKEHRHV